MSARRLLIVLALSAAPALQAQPVEFPLELIEYLDDVKVVAFVRPSALEKAPTWDPVAEPLPLGIPQALQAVRAFVGPDSGYRLRSIELKPIPSHPGHWHYLVRTTDPHGKPRYFAVLLDGTLIPATVEPESYK